MSISSRIRSVGLAIVTTAGMCLAVAEPASTSSAATNSVVLSGKVTDVSGHGWPLYATITVDGVSGGPFFTDPHTGKYTLRLPPDITYTLHVNANYPGYQEQSQTVTLGTANSLRNVNVGLPIDELACTAPGYAVDQVLSQPFDGPSTPAGWTVVNNTPVGGWEFDDPHPRGNLTGGAGGFAIVDSDFLGIGNTEDTFLISPIVDLSTVTHPVLGFDSDYHDLFSVADVDLSIDGGATWTNVWERAGVDARGPSHVPLPIAAAAGKTQVQVRFHYTATWAWWWEVDNVGIGECVLQPGGLVVAPSRGRARRTVLSAPA